MLAPASLLSLALVLSSVYAGSAPLPYEVFERAGIPRAVLDARAKCAINETFPPPTLPSALDLLKRDSFVTRKGTELFLVNEPFRIVGPNIYWLGLDENVVPNPSWPSKSRVLEAMGVVSAMHGTTIRGHTLGVSVGLPLSIEPALDVFNEEAYESVDFAILAARVYGLKLMIPLTDNYNWYHGGKYQFIEWNGIPFEGTGADITPTDVGAFFYNTTAIVDSFKRFITHHLNHVNRYTGIALKDDPTIIAGETGNELSAARFGEGPPPASWTREIAQHIKSLAPKQLVFDGTYGVFPESGQLDVQEVDIFSDHFYPDNTTKLLTGIGHVQKAGRVYLAGEIDWTGQHGGTELSEFLKTIEGQKGAGSLFWSLFGHSDDCCSWVEHDDGYSFFFERDDFYKAQGDILIAHAKRMNAGRAAAEVLPQLACASPGLGGLAEKVLAPFLPTGKAGAAVKSAMSA
ncbi:glycoside hydrolase [Exidia glandulosa HHB12029]|uniref:mannan endo-1,4-beta-mannosidase n=1 Tax=Exidia glandulosa HHB12029 TaxID=1314781 RepID=A0A165J206_EXIGL|nr:glycoside hydrolase [Exidia glandulosa HHB12029]